MNDPTLKDIYERMGGMDAKLDNVLDLQDDQETRLRALERQRNWLLGAWAGVTFLAGTAFSYFKFGNGA